MDYKGKFFLINELKWSLIKQTANDKSNQGSIKNGFGLILLKYCGFQMKVLLINELKWSLLNRQQKTKVIKDKLRMDLV